MRYAGHWAVLFAVLLGGVGCAPIEPSGAVDQIELVVPAGVEASAVVVSLKRDALDPQGRLRARRQVTLRLDASARVLSAQPLGAGPVIVHVVAVDAAGAPLAVGDATLPVGRGVVTLLAYDAACDADGDGFLTCGAVPAGLDCAPDDPRAHPFNRGESSRLRADCANEVDEDCDGVIATCATDDGDGDGVSAADGDCDDTDPAVAPGAVDRPGDGLDADCDGLDGGQDRDGDGVPAPLDCDDGDPNVAPGRPEVPCNQIDDDCAGGDFCPPGDQDGDGTPDAADCAPADPAVHPGAEERCNGRDDDCDGQTDEPGEGRDRLIDEGVAPCGPAAVGVCRPGTLWCEAGALQACREPREAGVEVCNGLDDDCDGAVDEAPGGVGPLTEPCYEGAPGTEGVAGCAGGARRCVGGVFGACLGAVEPTDEICDGADQDCDGAVDEGATEVCYTFAPETRGRGACADGARGCADGSHEGQPCEGEVGPTDEACNGVDDDCDGRVDEIVRPCGGAAGGGCRAGLQRCEAGAWGACVGAVEPAPETCDGRDEDCDGRVDEDFDLGSDAGHCGACGQACAAGQACCGGVCTPTDGPDHCGGCGVVCGAQGDRCVAGACACGAGGACPEGLRCLGGACVCTGDEGCGPDGLCCDGICQPGDAAAGCAACGDAGCPPESADRCVGRACQCGEGPACVAGLPCVAGACVGCVDDAQCADGGLCCDGACVAPSAAGCEACGVACAPDEADVCQVAAGQRRCVCGDAADATPCAPGTHCLAQRPGEGRCVQCRAAADCPGDRPTCLDNQCVACDPRDHGGCDAGSLCCGGVCVAADVGRCAACDQPCDPARADGCGLRACTCGGADACGAGAFCVGGACVACRDDGDCGGGQCVAGACAACDPADHAGCDADALCCVGAEGPRCAATGPVAGQCEACDAPCDPAAADVCADRACQCGDGPPCSGDRPACVGGVCLACQGDADCAGDPAGGQCVDGICAACDPADHSGCGPDALCCDGQCTPADVEAGCEACGVACGAVGDACVDRTCLCGGSPACGAAAPACVGGACVACLQDADCADGGLCCDGACVARAPETGCAQCGVACPAASADRCLDGACACGEGAGCGGEAPVCDAANGLCVGCLEDAHCDAPAVCDVARQICVECLDDGSSDGCVENSPTPICEVGRCRPCANDGECRDRPGARQLCVEGGCQRCDAADGRGCTPLRPVCDPGTAICRGCEADVECAGGDVCCPDGTCGAACL